MKPSLLLLTCALLLTSLFAAAEPTDNRDWRSTKGQTMTGSATAFEDGVVTVLRTDGKTVEVPLSLLIEEDQEFIETHFAEPAPEEIAAPQAPAPKKPKGKRRGATDVLGPEKSREGSHYFYYVPETLPAGAKVPALFWTGGGRAGNASDLQKFVAAADLTGTVLVCCGNSSNGGKDNSGHMHANLMHALDNLPIDKERLFFAGTSGGAGRAFFNAEHYEAAGALPVVGYLPSGCSPSKNAHYYLLTGSFDYNRYASSHAAKKFGKNATLRFFPGGHTTTTGEYLGDGLIWLYTMNTYEEGEQEEQQRFEERFYTYLTEGLVAKPWLAYYWTDHLLNACEISGAGRARFDELHRKLAADQTNLTYFKGREDLTEFGLKEFSSFGAFSKQKHTTPALAKAAAKLAKEYEGVVEIGAIAPQLGKKTD